MGSFGSYPRCNEYDTERDIIASHENSMDEVPNRTADCNSLIFIGTFATRKEAEAALLRREPCGMAYARFGKTSKAVESAKKLLDSEIAKRKKIEVETSIYNAKTTKTVGCLKCGSSFPRDYFRFYGSPYDAEYRYEDAEYDYGRVKSGSCTYVNTCPICGADMRSATSKARIDTHTKNIEKYQKRYEELSTPAYKYLATTKYYCG